VKDEQLKENYRCYATIRTEGIEIKGVLCKIFLPIKITEPVLIHFLPTEEQLRQMERVWKFSVECEFYSSPDHLTKIYAAKVYTHHSSTEFWQPDIAVRIVVAQPEGLTIDTLRNVGGESLGTESHGRYWLTPSKLLSPAQSVMRSFTGEVEVKTVWQLSFALKSGIHLKFANRFRYRKNDEGETVTYKELVADFEMEGGEQFMRRVEEGLRELDDLLVLTSFAERQRCLNIGYDTSEIDGALREYYRGNIVIPEFKGDRNNFLIEGADFNEFLQTAYKHFTSIESVDLVRQAINYVIPSERGTVQSIFISLYSALETIVLYLRRQANLEFIFSGDEGEKWRKFKSSLRKYIEQHPLLENDKEKQTLLKKNITALQRISFATAYEACLKTLSLSTSDLWPVTDRTEGWALSDIRNKLVHGDYLNRAQLHAVIFATEHIRWTVERLILAVLGWDIERSNVCAGYLRHMNAYNQWKQERLVLSEQG
jgi:hypothetical protein